MLPYHNLIVCNKTHMELLAPSFNWKLSTGFQLPLGQLCIVKVKA